MKLKPGMLLVPSNRWVQEGERCTLLIEKKGDCWTVLFACETITEFPEETLLSWINQHDGYTIYEYTE